MSTGGPFCFKTLFQLRFSIWKFSRRVGWVRVVGAFFQVALLGNLIFSGNVCIMFDPEARQLQSAGAISDMGPIFSQHTEFGRSLLSSITRGETTDGTTCLLSSGTEGKSVQSLSCKIRKHRGESGPFTKVTFSYTRHPCNSNWIALARTPIPKTASTWSMMVAHGGAHESSSHGCTRHQKKRYCTLG